jgi:hypothetical protein
MKSRKTLDHASLVSESIKIASIHNFCPDIHIIKNCIENLITREYI